MVGAELRTMELWGKIKTLGMAAASIKGWLYMLSASPAVMTAYFGFFENLPWSYTIALSTLALSGGIIVVSGGIYIFESTTNHFTTRKNQNRIARDLKELMDEGYTRTDTVTVAGIWSGTNDPNSLQMKLCFRRTKMAINNGDITGAKRLNPRGKANRNTSVSLVGVKIFFIKRGICVEEDF